MNGGVCFIVQIIDDEVKIYSYSDDVDDVEEDDEDGDTIYVYNRTYNPIKVFIGKYKNAYDDGNSILLQLSTYKYVYIGAHGGLYGKITTFETDYEIVQYESPIYGSDVPYPYAVDTDQNIYLFNEEIIIGPYDDDKIYKYLREFLHKTCYYENSRPFLEYDIETFK